MNDLEIFKNSESNGNGIVRKNHPNSSARRYESDGNNDHKGNRKRAGVFHQ